MSWTEQNFARAQDHYNNAYTYSEIAEKLNQEFGTGFTRNAVIGKFRRDFNKQGKVKQNKSVAVKVKQRRNPSSLVARGASPVVSQTLARRKLPVQTKRHKQREEVPILPPVNDGVGLDIVEIERGQCRWPISGEGRDLRMCGNETQKREVYCAGHMFTQSGEHGWLRSKTSVKNLLPHLNS